MHLSPLLPNRSGLGSCPFYGGVSVVVDPLLIVAPIVCGGFVFGLCYVIQYFVSLQCCITLMGKRELVTLLLLCF